MFVLARLLLAASLLAALVACAGDGADEAGDAPDDADDAAPDDADEASDDGDDEGDDEGEVGDAAADEPLTVYSGRAEELVGPVLDDFTEETGIDVEVRYGDTAELAAQLVEEGANSPADVFFAQDAGALGALRAEELLTELPDELVDPVDERFRAGDASWVGVSGRARTLVVNTDRVTDDEIPDSIFDLTAPEWEGRIGWAPTNGSFQAFVTGMRAQIGDDDTRTWLEAMVANDVRSYDNNTAQVEAAGRGEIDVGLVNHYYLYQFLEEDPDFPADNVFLSESGDPGALVNVAGVGVLAASDVTDAAEELVGFLQQDDAQRYFAEETFEYPLVDGVDAHDRLPPLEEIETPDLDLSELEDLEGTVQLLREAGVLS